MTEAETKVSVICAWYNRAEYLRNTIDSLLSQNFNSYEVVIVNDGSPDPRVRQILDGYNDPRLKVIHQENTGFVRAICNAISASASPFIAIQGAGDISRKNRIRDQYDFLESSPKYCAVGCVYANKTISAGGVFLDEIVIDRSGRFSREDLLKVNPLNHGSIMFRRSIYEKSGGYRSFFKFAQDRDLWIRMGVYGDFYILNSLLYDRIIFPDDGVAACPKKRIAQIAFSDMAKQAGEYKDRYDFDLISFLGNCSWVFRQRSTRLSKQFSKVSLIEFVSGQRNSALVLAKQACKEKITIYSLAAYFLCLSTRFFPEYFLTKIISFIRKLIKKKSPHFFSRSSQ